MSQFGTSAIWSHAGFVDAIGVIADVAGCHVESVESDPKPLLTLRASTYARARQSQVEGRPDRAPWRRPQLATMRFDD